MKKLSDVVSCLSFNRSSYKDLTSKEKEYYFFIINRFLSKKFPDYANKMNLKNIDKALALDLWFIYLKDKIDRNFMAWFWSKSTKEPSKLSNKEYKILTKYMKVKRYDIDFMLQYYEDEVFEELEYYKKLEQK